MDILLAKGAKEQATWKMKIGKSRIIMYKSEKSTN